jgi:hypothetical protein
MNILNEIDDFKRLSGLLTESAGGLITKLKRVPWVDDLLTPGVRASDTEVGKIARKIDSNGIRSLTDDELLYLLTKLPADKVANKLIKGNVFFTEAQVKRNLQGFLDDITQGNKTWDEIEELLTSEDSLRQLWGQSASPMTDDVYEGMEDILNEVGQKYLDDIEDFIIKNGSDSAKAKLPKQGILSKLGIRAKQKLNSTFLARQRFIINVLRNTTTSVDKLADEADVVFAQIKEKMAKGGNNYVDISSEVRKLTELATATNKVGDSAADEIFNKWVRNAGLSSEEIRKINKDKWKREWLDAITEYAKDDSTTKLVRDYVKAYGRLIPGLGKATGEQGFRNFAKRWANMVVYATPFKRKEIIGRLTNKGVQRVVASRIAGNVIQSLVIVPTVMGGLAMLNRGRKALIGNDDDERRYTEIFKDTFYETVGIIPITITYLDDVISTGVNAYEYLDTYSPKDTAEQIGGEVWADYQEAERILKGEGDDIDKNQVQKTKGVQRYIEREYPDFPYTLQIVVTSDNKVVFRQKVDSQGTIKYWPVYLIDGKIYLVNTQAKKRIELSKISGSVNEGLISVIFEQVIDWDSGESTSDDEVEYDDVTSSDWDVIFGSSDDEDGESSSTEEDGDGETGGVDLSFLGVGGSGSSGPGWEFNRNPTGQLRSDRDAARLDADSYTKGNIYVYKNPNGNEELVLAGKLPGGTPHLFKVEKNDSGKWGWINDSQEPPMWEDFKDY